MLYAWSIPLRSCGLPDTLRQLPVFGLFTRSYPRSNGKEAGSCCIPVADRCAVLRIFDIRNHPKIRAERRFFAWLGALCASYLCRARVSEISLAVYCRLPERQSPPQLLCWNPAREPADLFRAAAQFSGIWRAAEFGVCPVGNFSGAAVSGAGSPGERMAGAGAAAGGNGEHAALCIDFSIRAAGARDWACAAPQHAANAWTECSG